MKRTQRFLGAIWMAIGTYFAFSIVHGLFRVPPHRLDILAADLFFAAVYVAGGAAGSFLFLGAQWPRVVIGIVALLTAGASLMGLFAFFDLDPYSPAGILFDVFSIGSAGVLLFGRKAVAA